MLGDLLLAVHVLYESYPFRAGRYNTPMWQRGVQTQTGAFYIEGAPSA